MSVKCIVRKCSIKTVKNYKSFSVEKSDFKEFSEIPGPKGFLNLGTIFNYWFGKYDWNKLHITGQQKLEKYGKIVREKMLPGVYVLWIFDPADIALVLNDYGFGSYPQRKSHLALEKYRRDRPNVYRTGGLLPTNGSEWWKIRSEVQKSLSSPVHVRNILPFADEIVTEFIDRVTKIKVFDDFLPELSRLNLELTCHLAFDVRMNSFTKAELKPNSKTSKLIQSAKTTNHSVLPTDQGFQLWRFFETPSFKKLRIAQEYMESVAVELVSKTLETRRTVKISEESNRSLIDIYLNNKNLEIRDVTGMICDLILAGIDTTSFTTCYILYHLAKHKDVQSKLFLETLKILPKSSDPLTSNMLNFEVPYARAVLKESLRLNPISIGIGRILNRDLTLSNYKIPKNTIVVTQNQISCRLDEYFTNPNSFIPERWIKTTKFAMENRINPFLVLPFGHGMRGCVARRLAEQNMLILMIRLIRTFEVQWMGEDNLDFETKLINEPKQKIQIKFIQR